MDVMKGAERVERVISPLLKTVSHHGTSFVFSTSFTLLILRKVRGETDPKYTKPLTTHQVDLLLVNIVLDPEVGNDFCQGFLAQLKVELR